MIAGVEITKSLGSQSFNNSFMLNDRTKNNEKISKPNNTKEFQMFTLVSIKNVSDFQKKATLAKFSKLNNSVQDRSFLVPPKVVKKSVVQKNTISKYLQVT